MNSKAPSRLVFALIALLLVVGAISIGTAYFLSSEQTFTVYDEAILLTITGRFQTVADVIETSAVSLRPEDLVSPDLEAAADSETPIHIQRAKPVLITTEGGSHTAWTRQNNLQAFLAEAGIDLRADQQLLVNQVPIPPQTLGQQSVPEALEIVPREVAISISEGTQQSTQVTRATTVAEVLQEMDIALEESDRVIPAPAAPLEDGMQIEIDRALPLSIVVDGQTIQTRTLLNTPSEVLNELGITLGEFDYTTPAAETVLQSGDTIEVVRVSDTYRFEDEEIPFQTVYQPSEELDLDTKAVLSGGTPGTLRRRYRQIFENGVQVGEEFEEEWVEVEPVNQVIGYGTKITINTVDTPEGPREYWRVVRMRATAYTAASSGKPPDHPAYGITASGLPAGTGIVAVDTNVVPFRSEVFVPDYGIGFVGDTGGGVKGRWIDLGYDEDELVAWNRYADVYYLTPLPENINYLLPEVLP